MDKLKRQKIVGLETEKQELEFLVNDIGNNSPITIGGEIYEFKIKNHNPTYSRILHILKERLSHVNKQLEDL